MLFFRNQDAKIIDAFSEFAEEIILYPEKHLYDFEMLPTDENNLLQGIGEQRGNTSQIRPQFIHQLFEHQVKIRPDEIAVSFQEAQLSYAELNTKANQLAYFLREGELSLEVESLFA